MPSVRTKFAVGLFVIIGMTLVIVLVLILGMSQYFKEGRYYVAFFDESVQGLQKDSAVKYRGVRIGRVESISVAPDGNLIRIVFDLDEPLHKSENLVGQLRSIGITGIMFVELAQKTPDEPVASQVLSFEPKYPVIATKPSEMKQFLSDLYRLLDRINQIDVKGISDRVIATLDNINVTLEQAEIKKISISLQEVLKRSQTLLESDQWLKIRDNVLHSSQNLNQLLKDAGNTVSRVDESLKTHNKQIAHSIHQFKNAAESASTILQSGNALIHDTRASISSIDSELIMTLKNLELASRNVNALIQQILDQPSSLFFSSPPLPKQIEQMD